MSIEPVLYWHWWLLGIGCLVLETFVPGAIFLWTGISALAVGTLTWLVPLGWQMELALFAILSIVSFFVWRKVRPTIATDKPTLNRRGQSYVGRTFTLSQPIVNGIGTLHVDDSQWRIAGPDLPAGSQVRVSEADGATLRVERAH